MFPACGPAHCQDLHPAIWECRVREAGKIEPSIIRQFIADRLRGKYLERGWSLPVIGAANGNYWLGPFSLMVFIIMHYFFSDTAKADYLLAVFAMVIGLIIETLFLRTGVLNFVGTAPSSEFAPLWVVVLWANFALIMNGCLQWLQRHLIFAALLGSSGGAVSYFAGIKLGAATTGSAMPIVLAVIAVTYALVTPVFLDAARRLSDALQCARR